MKESDAGVIFEDSLVGPAGPGWRVAPANFVEVPGQGLAYLLDWQRRDEPFPVVGTESWSEYVVEIEVLPTSSAGFLGVSFHVSDDGSRACNVHFPVTGSGWSEAFQSMGIWDGICAWKLYPESQGYAIFPRGRWLALRLAVGRRSAQLYLGGAGRSVLTFHDLPFERGGVGLWSFCGSGYFRNLRILEAPPSVSADVPGNPWRAFETEEVLGTWDVVPRPEGELGDELPRGLFATTSKRWDIEADSRGVVNLSPLALEEPDLDAVLARTTVSSHEARTVHCSFTYTDHARVWCNGRLVLDGPRRGWNDPGREKYYGGRLIPDELDIELSLEAGDNELVVLSERTEPWGWGFWARMVRG